VVQVHPGPPLVSGSGPETWVTQCTGYMGNTLWSSLRSTTLKNQNPPRGAVLVSWSALVPDCTDFSCPCNYAVISNPFPVSDSPSKAVCQKFAKNPRGRSERNRTFLRLRFVNFVAKREEDSARPRLVSPEGQGIRDCVMLSFPSSNLRCGNHLKADHVGSFLRPDALFC